MTDPGPVEHVAPTTEDSFTELARTPSVRNSSRPCPLAGRLMYVWMRTKYPSSLLGRPSGRRRPVGSEPSHHDPSGVRGRAA